MRTLPQNVPGKPTLCDLRALPSRLTAAVLLLGGLALAPGLLHGDTVYLKNGAWIDGKVGYRTSTTIELEIGQIGKIQIPVEEIYFIEKNNRTGGELPDTYVDPEGKVEFPPEREGKSGGEEAEEPEETAQKRPEGRDSEIPSFLADANEDIDPELKARIDELVQDLIKPRTNDRVRAERHLKAIGRPAIPALIQIASHDNDLARVAVVKLFYAFGDERVIKSCIERLDDVNEYVRDYANKTLKRITGEDFGYVPYASPRRREIAKDKWAQWWAKEIEELSRVRDAAEGNSPEDGRKPE